MNATWNVLGWQVVAATAILGLALAASWLPRLAARTRHLVLVGGLLLAVVPARGWLEAVRLLGVDPATWFHRQVAVVTSPATAVVAAQIVAAPLPRARHENDPRPWLVAAWMLGAFGVLGLGLRHRRSRARDAGASSPEERSRLDRTRAALGVHRRVDLERRADTRVPCTRGICRPRIVLPATDDLTPDELDAVLAHELGHVARYDVLWGVLTGIIRAVLWFHPLAWWAAARASHEAECACDALATAKVTTIPVYLASLAKVCRHVASPAPVWATCISGGGLQERMARMDREHALLRQPRWIAGVAVLALVLISLGVASATTPPAPRPLPYTWSASVVRSPDGTLTCDARVVDAPSGEVVMEPRIIFRGPDPATATRGSTDRPFTVEVVAASDREAKVTFRAWQGDRLVQEETVLVPIQASEDEPPLRVGTRMLVQADGATMLTILVHERATRTEVWRYDLTLPVKRDTELTGHHGSIGFRILIRPIADGVAELESTVKEPGRPPRTATARVIFDGAISMEVEQGELGAVLAAFEKLTRRQVVVEVPLEGKVSVFAENEPWPDVLRRVLTPLELTYRLDGDTIHVYRGGDASAAPVSATTEYRLNAGIDTRPDGSVALHYRVVVAGGGKGVTRGEVRMPLDRPVVRGVPHGEDLVQVRVEPAGEGIARVSMEIRRAGEVIETTRAVFDWLRPEEQPIAAMMSLPDASARPYTWSVDLVALPDERLLAMVEVRDVASDLVVWQPEIRFAVAGNADASVRAGDVWLRLHADGVNARSAMLDLEVVRGRDVLQREWGSFQAR